MRPLYSGVRSISSGLRCYGSAHMRWPGNMTEADAVKGVDCNVTGIVVGIWIIAGAFGKAGHRIDSDASARQQSGYCKRDLAQIAAGLFLWLSTENGEPHDYAVVSLEGC